VVFVLALLTLAAITYLGYSCFSARPPGTTFADDVAHYPQDSVTYLAAGRSYLVRATTGDFLALSETEPQPADRVAGCVIRYRPDLQSNGETGLFRDDCHGDLYDRAGEPLTPGQVPMQRHPVMSSEHTVVVRFGDCLSGEGDHPAEACRARV